ncbi:MAG TPA: TIGR04282 family arsenosugar biosynthesis glycosyltransferase [Candidatus Acidoferrum sp.]|nr:TIGR04282 family arsenosugar biosynthesis glycosyltransferase [Candidatus Acidoferrum sp.]
MASMNRTLIIMAKAPRPGAVKTRLAKSFSLQAVTELYKCLLNDTIALAQTLDRVEIAMMCPADDLEDLSHAVAQSVRVVPQAGSGLAAALDSVFTQFAASGQPVIAFNSDSPHLPASVLKSAFDALEACDLVVGPTHDGGYYLVGARAFHPSLFSHDGMGTASALEALLSRTDALHLKVRLLDPFYDIDVGEDLNQLAEELQRIPGKAPRTAKWLSEWASTRSQSAQTGRNS